MRNGAYQWTRKPAALSPEWVRLDETPLHDLLAMSRDYAGALTFVNDSGRAAGVWSDLLDRDESILLARALSFRLDQRSLTLLDDFAANRGAQIGRHLEELATWLAAWFTAFGRLGSVHDRTLTTRLQEAALRGLGPELRMAAGLEITSITTLVEEIARWRAERSPSLEDLRMVYFATVEGLNEVKAIAQAALGPSMESKAHEPAAGLLLALTKAFQRVQDRNNQFTERHLNFYYESCLKMAPAGATPDTVYLTFRRAPTFPTDVVIPAGQPFSAGQTVSGQTILFQADSALTVTDAQVVALRTVRLERDPLISPERELGLISRARTAAFDPDVGPEERLQRDTVALMGGKVRGCISRETDARVGLAVTSPILWLKEGERTLDLTLAIDFFGTGVPPKGKTLASEPPSAPVATDGLGSVEHLKAGLLKELANAKDDESAFRALGNLFAAWLLSDGVRLTDSDIEVILKAVSGRRPFPLHGAAAPMTSSAIATDDPVDFASNPLLFIVGPIDKLDEAGRRTMARDELFASFFRIEASTADGWFEITHMAPNPSRGDGPASDGFVRLELRLTNEDPPITPCTAAVHGAEWPTDAPTLRLVVSDGAKIFPLSIFDNPAIAPMLSSIAVSVIVEGVRDLRAYNHQGLLDPTKPFQPFGPLPTTASYLAVGSPEAARKQVTRFDLSLEWSGLPEEGFTDHYEAYGPALADGAFKARGAILSDGRWAPASGDETLFTTRGGALQSESVIAADTAALLANWRATERPLVLDQNARSGFIRLQLSQPREAFGHQLYATVLSNALREGARSKTPPPLPNPPYTPTLNRMTLTYAASTVIRMGEPAENDAERVLHLQPFGVKQIHPAAAGRRHQVLTRVGRDGQLLIGLTATAAPQGELTLLFELREDTASLSLARAGPRPVLEWSWLAGDEWRPLEDNRVLIDTTKGFLTTGVVKLDLPPGLIKAGPTLPGELFWLKVASDVPSASFAGLEGVHAQAVSATRVMSERPEAPLEAAQISIKSAAIPGILAIRQPAAGFGFRPAETRPQARTRIAERLRHKQRASTAWDYERLVLEAFPIVDKVICLPNVAPGTGAASRGDVMVVVVPGAPRNDPLYATRSLQLDALQLDEIAAYLPPLASPFARIHVRNAGYERIQVRCRVSLRRSAHAGEALKRINSALVSFLSPWHDLGYDARFDWRVRADDIEACIRGIGEVQSVAGVSMIRIWEDDRMLTDPDYHFKDTATLPGQAEIRASKPWTLALPMETHIIELIDKEAADIAPRPTGIAKADPLSTASALPGLEIGSTFVVGDAS